MNPNYSSHPFPHVMIDDFYTPEELGLVWNELAMISPVLKPPEHTQAARSLSDGTILKSNLGVFINDVYKSLAVSPIVRANRKLFDEPFMNTLINWNPIFSFLPNTNFDNSLVQFYSNGQYYKPHRDSSTYSVVTCLYQTPKSYTGGELRFPDFDYSVDLNCNQSILFPSYLLHEVTPVATDIDDISRCRITISTFIGVR